jgi:hypothetical protein
VGKIGVFLKSNKLALFNKNKLKSGVFYRKLGKNW